MSGFLFCRWVGFGGCGFLGVGFFLLVAGF